MRPLDPVRLPRVLGAVQAERLGITRAQWRTHLRHGTWVRLATGVVLTRPDEPTRFDWAEAGVTVAGTGAAVTGWEALRARGLGDRVPPPAPPVVLMRAGLSRAVGGVRLRRTPRPYSTTLLPADADHLALTPVAGIARAVADAAFQHRELARVRALVTSALGHRLCTLDDLLDELAHGPRNGSALLRRALEDVLDGARSAAEAGTARRLASAPGVAAFELNVPVVRRGSVIYVLDAFWRPLRAGLEVDSRKHHFGADDWAATLRRHNTLTRYGLALSHYPPAAVRAAGWVAEVEAGLRARATELGVAYPRARGVIRADRVTGPAPFVVDDRP